MLSLYIHIPFCESKCFYCSFVVSVGQEHRMDAYLDCLAREAASYEGRCFASAYIGGGTPAYLGAPQLQRLFEIVRGRFPVEEGAEYTVEANPESLDEARLRVLRAAGVNRVSLGIQSLNDRYLKYLGRTHDADKARRAYRMVRGAGFDNVNVDLMFSFPGQTMQEIKEDVAGLTALGSEHISLYMLNVEEHSRFYAQKMRLPDDDLQAGQYRMVVAALERAGYGQYEISNFAKPGKESRHNLNYWQGGEYIGLGVGAHSYLDGKLFWNVDRLNTYLDRMNRGEPVVGGCRQLDGRERFQQALLIGLRMNRGVRVDALEKSLGCRLTDAEREQVEHFVRHGFLARHDGHLKATEKGRLVLDEICVQLS